VNCALIGVGVVGSATLDFFASGPLRLPLSSPEMGGAANIPIYVWAASRRSLSREGTAGEALVRSVLRQSGPGGESRFYVDAPRTGPSSPSWRRIVEDPAVDIVVEVTGSPVAEAIIHEALWRGKSVVTANKRVMSRSGYQLARLAERRGAILAYEASVGGGMPIVQTIGSSIGGRTTALLAIINGTTNFILSEMVAGAEKAGSDAEAAAIYPAALSAAVKRGLAEADPSDDVLGEDPRSKLIILAGLAFGVRLRPTDVYLRGIARKGRLTRESIFHAADLSFMRRQGYVPKLLAGAQRYADGGRERIVGWVQPVALPQAHALAGVRDSENACLLQAESPVTAPAGTKSYEIMLRGPGAGGPETASSVISDIQFCARQIAAGRRSQPGEARAVYNYGGSAFSSAQEFLGRPSLLSAAGLRAPFLLRFLAQGPPARLESTLRQAGVAARAVPSMEGGGYHFFETEPASMGALEHALEACLQETGTAGLSMDILYVPILEGAAWRAA
jgi:homoserine dehydrogenase